MQTGSLYYHFTSREQLVAEILHLGIQTVWSHVRTAVDALPADATPVERVAAAIRAHTICVLEINDYASAQTRIVGQVPPAIAITHRDDRRAYGDYWHALLVDADDAGVLAPGLDLFTARMLCFGAMNWTAEWFDVRRGLAAFDVADHAVAVLLAGLTGT